jgi:hypothetical protein
LSLTNRRSGLTQGKCLIWPNRTDRRKSLNSLNCLSQIDPIGQPNQLSSLNQLNPFTQLRPLNQLNPFNQLKPLNQLNPVSQLNRLSPFNFLDRRNCSFNSSNPNFQNLTSRYSHLFQSILCNLRRSMMQIIAPSLWFLRRSSLWHLSMLFQNDPSFPSLP